jgi:hypothetical protein
MIKVVKKRLHCCCGEKPRGYLFLGQGIFAALEQGCQIFLYTINPKRGKIYQIATKLPNGH